MQHTHWVLNLYCTFWTVQCVNKKKKRQNSKLWQDIISIKNKQTKNKNTKPPVPTTPPSPHIKK